jgi:hypothetical protein
VELVERAIGVGDELPKDARTNRNLARRSLGNDEQQLAANFDGRSLSRKIAMSRIHANFPTPQPIRRGNGTFAALLSKSLITVVNSRPAPLSDATEGRLRIGAPSTVSLE